MNYIDHCLSINSYNQALQILNFTKKNKITPILFINHNLINKLGLHWLIETKNSLKEQFGNKKFKICVDAKKNYGLFINLVENKLEYISVKADKEMLKKLLQIAELNKVLINHKFSIVDLSRTRNIKLKLEKLYNKNL